MPALAFYDPMFPADEIRRGGVVDAFHQPETKKKNIQRRKHLEVPKFLCGLGEGIEELRVVRQIGCGWGLLKRRRREC